MMMKRNGIRIIAIYVALLSLVFGVAAGNYTVVGNLTVSSNATLNSLVVQDGLMLETGTIQGDGSGLTNLNMMALESKFGSVSSEALALYLPFDREGGTDISGHNRHGTINGAIWQTEGFYQFDGVTNSITLANDVLDTNHLTIACFVKSTGNDNYNHFLSQYRYLSNEDQHGTFFSLYQRNGTDDVLTVFASYGESNNNFRCFFGPGLSEDEWYHVALTISANDRMKVFLDGTKVYDETFPGSLYMGAAAGYTFELGRRSSWPGNVQPAMFNFEGGVRNVVIFNRTLSENEVETLYERQSNNHYCPTPAMYAVNISASTAVDAAMYGGKNVATLSSVITQMAQHVQGGEVIVDGGVWNIDADLNVPAQVMLNIRPGSVLNVASGKTVTIRGQIVDTRRQMFSTIESWPTTGNGEQWYNMANVKLPNSSYVRPEWWGAVVNDSAGDAKAINSAIATRRPVLLSAGVYETENFVTPLDGTVLKGEGIYETILKTHSELADYGIASHGTLGRCGPIRGVTAAWDHSEEYAWADDVTVSDMTIDGNFDAVQAQGYTNITIDCALLYGEGITIRNCLIKGWGVEGDQECFPLNVGSPRVGATKPNIVEFCVFTEPGNVDNMSFAGMQINHCNGSSFPTNYFNAYENRNEPDYYLGWTKYSVATESMKIIRNCVFKNIKIVNSDGSNHGQAALCSYGNIVKDNIVFDCENVIFYNADTLRNKPVIITGNKVDGVREFVTLQHSTYGGTFEDIQVLNNDVIVDLKSNNARVRGVECAVAPDLVGNQHAADDDVSLYPPFKNVEVGNNVIKLRGKGATNTTFYPVSIWMYNLALGSMSYSNYTERTPISGVRVFNNVVDQYNGYFGNIFSGDDGGPGEPISPSHFVFYGNKYLNGDAVRPVYNEGRSGNLTYFDDAQAADCFDSISANNLDIGSYENYMSWQNLLQEDGGFGTEWSFFSPRSNMSCERGLAFEGQFAGKIVVTNTSPTEHNYALKGFHYKADEPTLVTVGAWFYVTRTNMLLHVQATPDLAYENAVSTYYATTSDDTNKWIQISATGTLPPITNTVEVRLGAVSNVDRPLQIGDTYYVDNAYLVKGKLPKNVGLPITEIRSMPNATTNLPLRIGEEVYNTTDETWYKANNLTTNGWKALN